MNLCDFAPEYIRSIQPYQPGKPISELAREIGLDESYIIKLASNENPLGTSPLALDAMINTLHDIALYPDGSGYELKAALSKRYGVDPAQIILGNGSNDVLDLAARVFLKPGAAAVYSQHAFAVYPLVVQMIGANGIPVPARDYGHDLPAMLDAITPETRIVFIASPNNPTGTLSGEDELFRFMERVSRDVLVVMDEAYYEYLPEANKPDSIKWLKQFSNLLITRTFSKVYGLAGVRVGFGLTHPGVANLMNRVRQPFNVNNLALAAALAALDDHAFLAESFELNQRGLEQIVAGLKRLGLGHIPAHGNFVTFHVANAAQVNQRLLKQGVIVRPLGNYAMPEHLRVTVGLERENARFLEALEKSL